MPVTGSSDMVPESPSSQSEFAGSSMTGSSFTEEIPIRQGIKPASTPPSPGNRRRRGSALDDDRLARRVHTDDTQIFGNRQSPHPSPQSDCVVIDLTCSSQRNSVHTIPGPELAEQTTATKRKLIKKTLQAYNITIHDSSEPSRDACNCASHHTEQSRKLQNYLLHFKHIITEEGLNSLEYRTWTDLQDQRSDSIIPAIVEAYREQNNNSESVLGKAAAMERANHRQKYNMDKHDMFLVKSREITVKSQRIRDRDEVRWDDPIKEGLFGSVLNISNSMSLDEKSLFRGSQHFFNDAQRLLAEYVPTETRRSQGFQQLTSPKPDLYLAFNIEDLESAEEADNFHDEVQTSFSKRVITDLERSGLHARPSSQFTFSNPDERYCCFPWAIIEYKHHGAPRESSKVDLQAANGAAASLAMLRNLANNTRSTSFNEDMPPLFAFTFIGPLARVYMARTWNDLGGQISYCLHEIWSGSLKNIWDTLKLCNIIDKVNHWAMTSLRSWIAIKIGLWLHGPLLEQNIRGDFITTLLERGEKIKVLSRELEEARLESQRKLTSSENAKRATEALELRNREFRIVLEEKSRQIQSKTMQYQTAMLFAYTLKHKNQELLVAQEEKSRQLERAAASAEEAKGATKTLEQKNRELQIALDEKSRQLKDEAASAGVAKSTSQALEEKNRELHLALQGEWRQVSRKNAVIQNLEARDRTRDGEIQDLQDALAEARSEISNRDASMQNLQSLEDGIQEQQRNVDEIQRQMEEKDARIQSLQDDKTRKDEQIREMEVTLDEAQERAQRQETQSNQLFQYNIQLRRRNREMISAQRRTRHEVQPENRVLDLLRSNQTLRDTSQELSDRVKILQEQVESREACIQDLRQSMDSLQASALSDKTELLEKADKAKAALKNLDTACEKRLRFYCLELSVHLHKLKGSPGVERPGSDRAALLTTLDNDVREEAAHSPCSKGELATKSQIYLKLLTTQFATLHDHNLRN